MRIQAALLFSLSLVATSTAASQASTRVQRDVRVVVGSVASTATPGAEREWVLRDAWGRVHARGSGPPDWSVERRERRVRIVFANGGRPTAWSDEPFTLSPTPVASSSDVASDRSRGTVPAMARGASLMWNGRRYRGLLAFVPTDTAILIVNLVDLESYLRGVVPLELGRRAPNEIAALEAQAIAARSYAVVRMREGEPGRFDLTSAAWDQVYGGIDAEQPLADAAVQSTAGMVLTFDGAVVRAPYHSSCGGRTIAPTEAWIGAKDEPYLRGVRDTPVGSERAWCEISPSFAWERTLTRRDLDEAVARYALAHGSGTTVGGGVRSASIAEMTRSGRVRTLVLETDDGAMRLSGTELRTTLRSARGEIVNSTYFSLQPVVGRDERLMQLTLRGAGNGHGVGMCQWGAIARARAGHDVRAILAAYYPGTAIARLP